MAGAEGGRNARGRFVDRVVEVVASIEPGQVLTYGEVAAEAGAAGAARAVGRVLRDHGGELPWWRVVTASGRLVPRLEDRHAALLEREGHVCQEGRLVLGRQADRR